MRDIREMKKKTIRCPYCVVRGEFQPLDAEDDRLTCQSCGHAVVPNDRTFRCICLKCAEIDSSLKIRQSLRP
jgi:DNA-directed RNA polymerase subunit RPC12/RpoP